MQKNIPQLDAVRGIAIILVLMVNTCEKYPSLHLKHFFGNGWMGVDFFFVLSGLLDNWNSPRLKKVNGLFQEFLRPPMSPNPAALLCRSSFHVCDRSNHAPFEAHVIFEKSSPWWAYPLFLQNFLQAVPDGSGRSGVS